MTEAHAHEIPGTGHTNEAQFLAPQTLQTAKGGNADAGPGAEQFGFDFSDVAAPVFRELEDGAWSEPFITTPDFHAMIARAREVLPSLTGAAAVIFAGGLAAAQTVYAEMMEIPGLVEKTLDSAKPFRLWRVTLNAGVSLIAAFRLECANGAGSLPGIEFKTRHQRQMAEFGMYVPEIGSVVVYEWSQDNIAIEFFLWRDGFFNASFRDENAPVPVPEALFAGACAAAKIATSNEDVASVPTFVHECREYINTGEGSVGTYRECIGWAFCSLTDWRGPTYSYRTQCAAWDAGRTERGDCRGLLVRVRGRLAVLSGMTIFFDENAAGCLGPSSSDDEEDGADNDMTFEGEEGGAA